MPKVIYKTTFISGIDYFYCEFILHNTIHVRHSITSVFNFTDFIIPLKHLAYILNYISKEDNFLIINSHDYIDKHWPHDMYKIISTLDSVDRITSNELAL